LKTNLDALFDTDHLEHAEATAKFGFLSDAYVQQCWYWEIVMLIQKLLLTGVIIFIKVQQLAHPALSKP
jgi:cytochrome b subunit of formate dehydrogenase